MSEKKNRKTQYVISAGLPLDEKLALRLGPETYRKWREMWALLSRLYLRGFVSKRLIYVHISNQIDLAVTKGLVNFAQSVGDDVEVRTGAAGRVRAIETSDKGTEVIANPYETPAIESILQSTKQRFWYSWVDAKLEELDETRNRLSQIDSDLYPPVKHLQEGTDQDD